MHCGRLLYRELKTGLLKCNHFIDLKLLIRKREIYFRRLSLQICSCSFYAPKQKFNLYKFEMEKFVEKQLDLLETEHEAEIEQKDVITSIYSKATLKKKGVLVTDLEISSLKLGLYGRNIATFSSIRNDRVLPFNVISNGDIVKLYQHTEDKYTGIVNGTSDKHISVVFDDLEIYENLQKFKHNHVGLVKVSSEVTYKRLKKAMQLLGEYQDGRSKHLVDILFGNAVPTSSPTVKDVIFYNRGLDDSQRKAVKSSLEQNNLSIIHGPPGTGKTTVIVEIIMQLVYSNKKVLACAPSNVAVDNLVEKLSKNKLSRKMKLVRLGHPARMLDDNVQCVSLDALIDRHDNTPLIKDIRREIDEIEAKFKTSRGGQHAALRKEKKLLLAELRKRKENAQRDVLKSADVILATNVGSHMHGPIKNLPKDFIDVSLIDECGQALEASCWLPLLQSSKLVLAGDHLQLPPTIISHEAAEKGLSLSLLERQIKLHGDSMVSMLTQQYRMHYDIMEWASNQMYDGKLTADSSVKDHLLSDLPCVEANETTRETLMLVDTSGCDMHEVEAEECDSKGNIGEAKIVYQHVQQLLDSGVKAKDIAVISPYNLQVDILKLLFRPKHPTLEIRSVDGFQGREKEAVVLSLVRSNDHRQVGFLADDRRLNVAVTRARRHLCVICDVQTVSAHHFIETLIDHMTLKGQIKSGFEYDDFDSDITVLGKYVFTAPNFDEAKKRKPSKSKQEIADEKLKEKEKEEKFRTFKNKYRKLILSQLNNTKYSPQKDDQFVLSQNGSEMVFSNSLSGFQRGSIHEVCSELKLTTNSVGLGKNRNIIVTLKPILEDLDKNRDVVEEFDISESEVTYVDESLSAEKYEKPSENTKKNKLLDVKSEKNIVEICKRQLHVKSEVENITSSNQQNVEKDEEIDKELYSRCTTCNKSLPKENLQIHSLHCERSMRLKEKIQEEQNIKKYENSSGRKSGKNKKLSGKNSTSKTDAAETDDFDSLINEAISSNKKCGDNHCSASVATIGQYCVFCNKTFCLKHSIPEVHGCGEKVRNKERKQFCKGGYLYNTGGKSTDKNKKAAAKKKYDDKIKEMRDKRKHVSKSN